MATPHGDDGMIGMIDDRSVESATIHASIAHGNGYDDAVLTTLVQENSRFTDEAGSPHRTTRISVAASRHPGG